MKSFFLFSCAFLGFISHSLFSAHGRDQFDLVLSLKQEGFLKLSLNTQEYNLGTYNLLTGEFEKNPEIFYFTVEGALKPESTVNVSIAKPDSQYLGFGQEFTLGEQELFVTNLKNEDMAEKNLSVELSPGKIDTLETLPEEENHEATFSYKTGQLDSKRDCTISFGKPRLKQGVTKDHVYEALKTEKALRQTLIITVSSDD